MTEDGLRGVAFHEAGHAVVALALGLPVARVEVFEDDHSGATDIVPSDHLPLVDQIAICVAGMNASEMFDAPILHEYANISDHGRVMGLLRDIAEAEGDVLRDAGHQRAWDLLTNCAGRVEDIAARLIAERKIDLSGYVLSR